MATEIVSDEDNPMLLKSKETSGINKDDIYSKLFPKLPEDYFKDKKDIFEKTEKNIFERYRDAKIKPYFSAVDFNNSKDEPYKNKPKVGYEIGIKISF